MEEQKEETRKNSREKVTSTVWTPPRLRRSPFVQEILSDPLPASYKSVALEYDRREDPSIHMARFEELVTLHQYSEGIKCRIFSTTLVGVAQQWLQKLEENSITSFEDLYDLFMRQFVSSRRATRSAMSLMDMCQEANEGLREYLALFNKVSLEALEVETQLKLHAFNKGLKPGPLFDYLQVNEAKTYEELLLRIPGYIHLEEARAARRAEQEKNKPKKDKYENLTERQPPSRGPPPRQNFIPEYQPPMQPDLNRAPPTRNPGHQGQAQGPQIN